MPLKLIPPRQGRSQNYRIRGTYLGCAVDQSARTHEEKIAERALKKVKRDIESGAFSRRGGPTFLSAAVAYMDGGGEARFLGPLIEHLGETPLGEIDQVLIDNAAMKLYPAAKPVTRNRQVYSPVSAVLRHAHVSIVLNRPKGSQGETRTDFLWPDQAQAVFAACGDDQEWRAFLTLLCYTGVRLSEALKPACNDLRIEEAVAYIGKTKNGDPRMVYLPPIVVAELANHPRRIDRGEERVFSYSKCGALYKKLDETFAAAGVPLKPGMAFHIFRHTYGTWMRSYGGLTREGLVETGVWRSASAAGRYDHADVSLAAKKADLLPVAKKA